MEERVQMDGEAHEQCCADSEARTCHSFSQPAERKIRRAESLERERVVVFTPIEDRVL